MEYFTARKVSPAIYVNVQLPAWLLQILAGDTSLRILDVGCGFGQMLTALRNEGFQFLSGVDISLQAIEHCQSEGFDVTTVDIANSSLNTTNKFDVIICSHVIEHIEKSKIISVLANLRMYLSERGRLILLVPNAQANTGAYWAYEDFTHTTLFTSGSVYYVAKMAGFKSINFLDTDCTMGGGKRHKYIIWPIVRLLLWLYKSNRHFWNYVTGSAYHAPSHEIYSYEIKAILS
jgi:SAM-dependent methyltransferase